MVDAVVEGRVVVAEAEVVVSEAGPDLVVPALEAGANVSRAELLEGPEDLLFLSPDPPERLDTEDPAELEHNLADLQLSSSLCNCLKLHCPVNIKIFPRARGFFFCL